MLAKCISDYNDKVVVKRWKIDSKKRKIIQNLLKCSAEFLDILVKHYDQHRHANSGAQPTLAECFVFGEAFFQTFMVIIITLCCYMFVVAVLLRQGKKMEIGDHWWHGNPNISLDGKYVNGNKLGMAAMKLQFTRNPKIWKQASDLTHYDLTSLVVSVSHCGMGRWRCLSRSRTPPKAALRRFEPSSCSCSEGSAEDDVPETSSESGGASDQEFHALILCFGFKVLLFLIGFSDCFETTCYFVFEPLILRLRQRANLSLPHLASLRAATSSTDKDDQGHFTENGVDESRIRKVLANKNHSCCSCSNRFHS